jgi:hypothetical protein
MRTSTKVFLSAALTYGIAAVFYLIAREIWNDDLERLKQSVFWGSTLDIGPYLNLAHYVGFVFLSIAVAICIAGILLRQLENGRLRSKIHLINSDANR